ncbi:phytoene/squalene synthase family protein [Nocardiopsis sediminis]|uniref:Phytoene/squalene synthase family protein n=1 Tax=Nocardiopsis sediminis TaxID=1778267 RepID=A0ABV8FQF2_9ACTN
MSTRELDAAGFRDLRLRDAYGTCQTFLRHRNSATYPAASKLLPPGKRPYWDAVFAFTTYVDDLIDDPLRLPEARTARFDDFERMFFLLLKSDAPWREAPADGQGRLPRQLSLAFLHTVRTWDITEESVRHFMATIRTDLHTTDYPLFADLHAYIYGVCAVGTQWGNALLEPHDDEAARRSSSMSLAVQLTDILLDLREDLAVGRLYLPVEDLRRFGLTRADVEEAAEHGRLTGPLRELVRFEADRARDYFDDAADWWRLAHPCTRELPRLYVQLGREALESISRADYDVFRPARAGRLRGAARAGGASALAYARSLRLRAAARGRPTTVQPAPVGPY